MYPRYLKALSACSLRLVRDAHGGLVVILAFALPVLLLGTGAAIDYGYIYLRRTALQSAVDAAALAGANELMLANANADSIPELTQGLVAENLEDSDGVQVATTVSVADRTVHVEARQSHQFFLMGELAGTGKSEISASATAKVAGEIPVCMLILHPSDTAALALNHMSKVTGNGCAVYANSTSSRAILASNGAKLSAKMTCSGGGYRGDNNSFDPTPLTGCTPLDDPLDHRHSPPLQRCTDTGVTLTRGTHTLHPGTYCDGLQIGGSADVTFEPGIYVILDGKLIVGGQAQVRGEHVGFFMAGRGSTFDFLPQTTIDLSAPKDGPLAGILFYESRETGPGRQYVIRSNGARSFVGTIYLPNGNLVIDAAKPVFADSAYTVIIAQRMTMFSGPNLILNSNYEGSDVPLPHELEGLASHGKNVILIK